MTQNTKKSETKENKSESIYQMLYSIAKEYASTHKGMDFADGYMIGSLNMLSFAKSEPEAFEEMKLRANIEKEILMPASKKK